MMCERGCHHIHRIHLCDQCIHVRKDVDTELRRKCRTFFRMRIIHAHQFEFRYLLQLLYMDAAQVARAQYTDPQLFFHRRAKVAEAIFVKARELVDRFGAMSHTGDDYRHQGLRKRLVEEIKRKRITDARVLAAIGSVPRHLFIDDSAFLSQAYIDQAFPIGHGQTISQPYTVAMQTQLLMLAKGEKVLEIGTGCGYQTAVLCEMGAKVFSIERNQALHIGTKHRLTQLGYRATLIFGDGYIGLPQHAPFDRIIVTCGAQEIPDGLKKQLRVGGNMVVPVGADGAQIMLRVLRNSENDFAIEPHGAFSFVPMLSDRHRQ